MVFHTLFCPLWSPPYDLPRSSSNLSPQCTSRHPASVGRPGTGSLLGSTESRMRRAVQRCWREIQRNCTKIDHQREGHISTTSFLGERWTAAQSYLTYLSSCAEVYILKTRCSTEILRSLGIDVTQEQFDHLAGKFGIIVNGCVSYLDFLQHFLLKLDPSKTKRAFGRHQLPFPATQVQKR